MAFEFRLPDIGEGVAEGEIVRWHVNVGDTVREDDVLVEVMTDKVTAEIPSPCSGVLLEQRFPVGAVVPVGAVLAVFEKAGAATSAPKKEAAATVAAPATATMAPTATAAAAPYNPFPSPVGNSVKVLAAPATRKMARQIGLDLSIIPGSGPNGRITPDDVRRAAEAAKAGKPIGTPIQAPAPRPAVKAASGQMTEERVPLAGMRRRIAEHLVHSKQTAPHFGYVDEVDMTEIVRMREDLKAQTETDGVQLTFLPFIMKAVLAGLRQFPMLNASLDDAKQEIVYKHYFNLGIAVATDEGLIVPVLHHADQYNLKELAVAVKNLSDRARAGKLTLDDMRGGTFTLTSIGSVGGLFGLPIINHPEVAILGINKISDRPAVVDGQIAIRKMMHLSISCDHRVVDGVDAAKFVNYVKALLENPARLLYEI